MDTLRAIRGGKGLEGWFHDTGGKLVVGVLRGLVINTGKEYKKRNTLLVGRAGINRGCRGTSGGAAADGSCTTLGSRVGVGIVIGVVIVVVITG